MAKLLSKTEWTSSIESVRQLKEKELSEAKDCFISLGGRKTVRMVVSDDEAWNLINRELKWVISSPVPNPDATIVLLQDDNVEDFFDRVYGVNEDNQQEFRVLFSAESNIAVPRAQLNIEERTIHLADGDTYYFVTESYRPEEWIK